MKKTIIIIIFIGIILFGMFIIYDKPRTFFHDGIIFAVTLDGKEQMSFPDYDSGKYKVKINCNNATGKFKPIEQEDKTYKMKFLVEDIKGTVACTADFQTISSDDQLNNFIKSKLKRVTFSADDGLEIDVGYRYDGKYPSNYVWFNDEMWRIIGVFETELSSGEKQMLTKIIKDEPIGRGDLKGNWPDSNIYKLLNEYYLNALDGTNSGYCTATNSTVTLNCDYSVKGLGKDSYYGKMLKNVKWYLGAMSNSFEDENYYATDTKKWYEYERNNIVYGSDNTTSDGYIGLLHASDYGFSSKPSSGTETCSLNTKLSSFTGNSCPQFTWLYDLPEFWLINKISHNHQYFFMNSNGSVGYSNYAEIKLIKPVVYLSEDVYVINGTGTESDPYIIGM